MWERFDFRGKHVFQGEIVCVGFFPLLDPLNDLFSMVRKWFYYLFYFRFSWTTFFSFSGLNEFCLYFHTSVRPSFLLLSPLPVQLKTRIQNMLEEARIVESQYRKDVHAVQQKHFEFYSVMQSVADVILPSVFVCFEEREHADSSSSPLPLFSFFPVSSPPFFLPLNLLLFLFLFFVFFVSM